MNSLNEYRPLLGFTRVELFAGITIVVTLVFLATRFIPADQVDTPIVASIASSPQVTPAPPAAPTIAPLPFTAPEKTVAVVVKPVVTGPNVAENLMAQTPPKRKICATLVKRDATVCSRYDVFGKTNSLQHCNDSARSRLEACNAGKAIPSLNFVYN